MLGEISDETESLIFVNGDWLSFLSLFTDFIRAYLAVNPLRWFFIGERSGEIQIPSGYGVIMLELGLLRAALYLIYLDRAWMLLFGERGLLLDPDEFLCLLLNKCELIQLFDPLDLIEIFAEENAILFSNCDVFCSKLFIWRWSLLCINFSLNCCSLLIVLFCFGGNRGLANLEHLL